MFERGILAFVLSGEGITIIFLALCSVLSLAVMAERWRAYREARRTSRGLAEQAARLAAVCKVGEALDGCRLASPSPVAAVLGAGLRELAEVPSPNPHWLATPALERALAAAQGAMGRTVGEQIARLERYLGILGTLGNIAPFIGLFGTVLGIMDAFGAIGRTGSGGFATVSSGIYKALAATAAGLFVAIPAVIAYNYFLGRIKQFTLEMEHAASALVEAVRKRAV
jgi:biopolymer transport protein ExbB/biopolymer transport protein TolQ